MPLQVGKSVYSVQDFVSWQRMGGLVLSPSFQRRAVWTLTDKSYFLDTVTRSLPTSILYLREFRDVGEVEAIREVVDGQQRLRTLFAFIDPTLLEDFDHERDGATVQTKHNPDREIRRKAFNDLSLEIRRSILDYQFSTHILPAATDDAQVLQIFARLNSSGTKLEPQELRNAQFSGAMKTLAYQLAHEQLQRWRTWGIFDENEIARMREVELTSELIFMMERGILGKRQRALDVFYEEYDEEYPSRSEAERRFHLTMDTIEDLIEDPAATVFSRQAMFYTLFSFCYDYMYGLESPMKRKAPNRVPLTFANGLTKASNAIKNGDIDVRVARRTLTSTGGTADPDDDFVERLNRSLRGATSDAGSRRVRLEFLTQTVNARAGR